MSFSRRQLLLGSSSALWLAACGGGGSDSGDSTPAPPPAQTLKWSVLSRSSTPTTLGDVTSGNGVLVAYGSNRIGANLNVDRAMSYSESHGDSWTAIEVTAIDEFSNLQGLAFGGGRFVAVSSRGHVITSTNGKTWTLAEQFLDADSSWFSLWSVTFGNGVFMIMGQSLSGETVTWASADGLSWSDARPVGLSFIQTLTRRVFVDGSFYHLGEYSIGVAEGDGSAWAPLQITVANVVVVVSALAYGGGQWVAVTNDGFVASSPDFVTWTVRLQLSNPTGAGINVSFVNETFVLLMAEKIYTSKDGSAWAESTVGVSGDSFQSVAFDGTRFVVTGNPGLTAAGILT